MANRLANITLEGVTVVDDQLNFQPDAIVGEWPIANLAQKPLAVFAQNLLLGVVHDAPQTRLPGTSATDDIAIVGGTVGTDAIHWSLGDLKAAGATTRYARLLIPIPANYDAGQTVQIRVRALMQTTVADTSCTVDVEAYETDGAAGVGSDLCTTAAQSMNSATAANYDFTVTSSGLTAGDLLDVRFTIACNDGATGTAVEPTITAVQLLCDTRG